MPTMKDRRFLVLFFLLLLLAAAAAAAVLQTPREAASRPETCCPCAAEADYVADLVTVFDAIPARGRTEEYRARLTELRVLFASRADQELMDCLRQAE